MIALYDGSKIIYDETISFEEFPQIMGADSLTQLEGVIRRQWCKAPKERSPLEIIKNYEQAIQQRGGEILFITREAKSHMIEGKKLEHYFKTHRKDRGLATNVFSYTNFPESMSEFLTARLRMPDGTYYLTIASGRGHWAAREDNTTYFEIITLRVAAMELDKISPDILRDGIATYGKAPVYNIHFETGSAKVREDSQEALEVIATFIKQNSSKRFLVVGHTDNVGAYEMNQDLSFARANAVVEKLVEEFKVVKEQVKAVGVGPASPQLSNSTNEGKAKNRRVEIVER